MVERKPTAGAIKQAAPIATLEDYLPKLALFMEHLVGQFSEWSKGV